MEPWPSPCFDGTFERMKYWHPTTPFQSGMQLTIEGRCATLRYPGWKWHRPRLLQITDWNPESFSLDWGDAHLDWGDAPWNTATFEQTWLDGVEGLLEKGKFFWRKKMLGQGPCPAPGRSAL